MMMQQQEQQNAKGWTIQERRAMLDKMEKFYEAYYFLREQRGRVCRGQGVPSRERALDEAERRMRTLEYNDVFTCREILRLLHESLGVQDTDTRRNLLTSVFNLMLVHDETDPQSWTLGELHELWKKIMRGETV